MRGGGGVSSGRCGGGEARPLRRGGSQRSGGTRGGSQWVVLRLLGRVRHGRSRSAGEEVRREVRVRSVALLRWHGHRHRHRHLRRMHRHLRPRHRHRHLRRAGGVARVPLRHLWRVMWCEAGRGGEPRRRHAWGRHARQSHAWGRHARQSHAWGGHVAWGGHARGEHAHRRARTSGWRGAAAAHERRGGVASGRLRSLRTLRGLRLLLAARCGHRPSRLLVELRQMSRRQQVARLLALGPGLRVRVTLRAQGYG